MKRLLLLAICCVPGSLFSATAWAAAPTAEQALKLTPVQPGVDYDRPTPEQAARCKIIAKRIDGHMGWIVESPEGVILRKFVDTDDDKVVDQWSYYKDGLEVYRDIDSKHTGKVDQCRWFHTGGTRWGLDPEGTGTIQTWKQISPEEVTAEIVAAMATQDSQRFVRLVITPAELRSLGLGRARAESVAEKARKAVTNFGTMSARQETIGRDAVWTQFSAGRPGVVPAGTNQSTRDLRVYENVIAIAESGGKHAQVLVGTLVQVGDAWRVIDLPQPMVEGQAESPTSGLFFAAVLPLRNDAGGNAPSETLQKLLAALESLDREASTAGTPADQARFTARRAELLEQIAAAAKTADERGVWLRQLADMLSAGAVGHLSRRHRAAQGAVGKVGKPQRRQEPDRLYQVPPAHDILRFEHAGGPGRHGQDPGDSGQVAQDAGKLRGRLSRRARLGRGHAATGHQPGVQRAGGRGEAVVRADRRRVPRCARGPESGRARSGSTASAGSLRCRAKRPPAGRSTFPSIAARSCSSSTWTTTSPVAKADMATLKEMWNKYGRSLAIVGVSLDNDVKDLNAYLGDNPLPWPQIFEEGGLDSRPANALGILTIPTMILADQEGKVVNRNVSTTELESEIKKLLR